MPDGVRDWAAEIWRPLVAIADAAGGHWPETARAACSHFVDLANADRNGSGQRLQLLADLRELFVSRDADGLASAEIVDALLELDESDWSDVEGKPLDKRKLTQMHKPYGVVSKDIRESGGRVVKGYRIAGAGGLADAWDRYLPISATAATRATPQVTPVADTGDVADPAATDTRDQSAA